MENDRFNYILNYGNKISFKTKRILKDIIKNHNNSWAKEIFNRNKDNLDQVALFYRGKKITYRELRSKVTEYAKSLATMGCGEKIKEIPICMSNTPEFVYLILAANELGIRVNIFNEEFDKNYIKEIIKGSNSKLLFATDDRFKELYSISKDLDLDNIVLFSLTDSLPNNVDPYIEIDKYYYDFKNRVSMYKEYNSSIIDQKQFIEKGVNYNEIITDKGQLDDKFLITYTSGSTNTTKPKAMIHRNSSLIIVARFHDKDASSLPTIKGFTTLAQIPTHSNTDVITSISDTLAMKCTVALEPIYNEEFFINSMLINKPNYVLATRCFWLTAFKKIFNDKQYKGLKMPFLLMPTAVGEPFVKNEEKFCNKVLKIIKAGTQVLPAFVTCMSIGGGDCEHGGLFFTFYKALKQKLPKFAFDKNGLGLEAFEMVDCAILDENGKIVENNTLGRLVANSPCTMFGYKDNDEATKNFFIKDINGINWADCKVYAFLDKNNTVHIKGRIGNEISLSNGCLIPMFQICDTVLKDTKNILSCEANYLEIDDVIVIDIECQPHIKSEEKIMKSIESANKRCVNNFPLELTEKIVYRLRGKEKPFPVTGCGKRNNLKLQLEGLESTFQVLETLKKLEKSRIK